VSTKAWIIRLSFSGLSTFLVSREGESFQHLKGSVFIENITR